MKIPRKKLVIAALVFGVIGVASYTFRYSLSPKKHFKSAADLATFVEGPYGRVNALWRGTPYLGERDGRSLFLHKREALPNMILTAPATSWKPPHRNPFTKDQDRWVDWHDCLSGMGIPQR